MLGVERADGGEGLLTRRLVHQAAMMAEEEARADAGCPRPT